MIDRSVFDEKDGEPISASRFTWITKVVEAYRWKYPEKTDPEIAILRKILFEMNTQCLVRTIRMTLFDGDMFVCIRIYGSPETYTPVDVTTLDMTWEPVCPKARPVDPCAV